MVVAHVHHFHFNVAATDLPRKGGLSRVAVDLSANFNVAATDLPRKGTCLEMR